MKRTILLGILQLGICFAGSKAHASPASGPPLYSVDEAISKGVVNARISLFNATDQKHVLDSIASIDPGMIFTTFVGVWGSTRQQDLDSAGKLADALRQRVPRTILGGGVGESVSLSLPAQTLSCGNSLGARTFVPNDLIDPKQHALGDTAWLDLANSKARDYYLCVGAELIDRGYTLINFPEHENVIAHASSRQQAVENFVFVLKELRSYGAAKGYKVYFSGDPSTDGTAQLIDFLYVPSRFFHTSFAQKYQNKIVRKGIGVGYAYSLSPRRAQDLVAAAPQHARVFFYIDNWDPKQDDLRRFMELDAENRRYLIATSAQTAHKYGAYFIPSLLHCVDCIAAAVVGDRKEIRPDGKTEYDAVTCDDIAAVEQALAIER